MGKRLKPILNKEYGCYKIVSDEIFMIKDKNKDHCRGYYFCECIICKKQRYVRSDTLFNCKTTKCKYCHNKSNYENLVKNNIIDHKGYSVKHRGTGDLSKTWVLTHVKYGAISRNLEFDSKEMSTDFLWKLFLKQDKKCALTGLPITLNIVEKHHPKTYNGNCHPNNKCTASLDRIDNTKGYIRDNVHWVHRHVNTMKLNHTLDYFIYLCTKISEYANQQPSIEKEHNSINEGSETRELSSSNNNILQENPTS